MGSVRTIIDAVMREGDSAVRKFTRQFDGADLDEFSVSREEVKRAHNSLEKKMVTALELAAENIRNFAEKQKEQFLDFEYEIKPGVFTGQKVIPIQRVAVYAPGGNFPLPSTVLMGAIPAQVAGSQEIVLASPPTFNNSIHPAILVAADICGISEIYKIGGVQAIAALAYGTETIKQVDKIVGPGNKYVTAAKKLVFGAVGIDFIAGPTEVFIIADDSANSEHIAADLLSQAEHDTNAVPILITDSEQLAQQVIDETEKQLTALKTADIARESIAKNGTIILVGKLQQAIEIANRKAPEHLELQVRQPEDYADKLLNYGSLFIGENAVEALGDYSSGLNHTLPTNTTARYTGGLSVKDFLKFQTTLRVEKGGLIEIGPAAREIGILEGLIGHAASIERRLKNQ
ncbi:histidinol dehydrogenase [candidate division KSB1 bacterium]|nr:histidinol dehydrogenase [candidate division KSB1 bacterium]